jgi:hypothetical protein
MGVDYTAILAVGKEFENESEAAHFLRAYDLLSATDMEGIENGESLSEMLPLKMDGSCLNFYTGYGYYIGYDLRSYDPDSFREDFESAVAKWKSAFEGKEKAEIIHTVMVH